MPGLLLDQFHRLIGAGAATAFTAAARGLPAALVAFLLALPRGRPGPRRTDFATKRGKRLLGLLDLVLELTNGPLEGVAGHVQMVGAGGHLVSFHPS